MSPTLMTPTSTQPSLRMTEQEFVAWSNDDAAAEWVEGEVVLKVPADEDHAEIQALIRAVVELFVKRRRIGKVRGPNMTMRLALPAKTARRDPDVMVILNESLPRLERTLLEGPAELAVEVVSRDSEFRDFNQKYREYEQGGVREYWIVNPLSQQVHLFVRDAKTHAFARREADEQGRFRSTVLDGVWFRAEDLFSIDRPDAITLLKQIDPTLV